MWGNRVSLKRTFRRRKGVKRPSPSERRPFQHQQRRCAPPALVLRRTWPPTRRRTAMDWDDYNYNDVLKVKIDIPDELMKMHMDWHEETAENGGRSIPAGNAGSGLEFLQFHRQFISCVKDWWQSENGTETPWP